MKTSKYAIYKNNKERIMWKDLRGNKIDIDKMIRLDENGKFITQDTKIYYNEKENLIAFVNKYPDKEEQRLVFKLKNKSPQESTKTNGE